MTLAPHRAAYAILGRDGATIGTERLQFARTPDGWHVRSDLEAGAPLGIGAHVEWELRPDLSTRLLQIISRDDGGDEYELELAVTGNGLLAHRVAPDGPSQVELGWGPDAELDYLSAAFPAVIVARSAVAAGAARPVNVVELSTEGLEPVVIAREYRLVEAAADSSQRVLCTTTSTGHQATLDIGPNGELLAYGDLLTLLELTPL